MTFDFSTIPASARYKLLTSVVIPRPIAFVTTTDRDGVVNAAPFSFFNCFGSDPAIVAIGIGDREPGVPKDTAANIAATGEFVVNLVTEAIVNQMNLCATDFPAGTDELKETGLTAVASRFVRPPRIGESPVGMECRHHQTLTIGSNRMIVGEVVAMHVDDDLVDPKNFHVAQDLHAIGRLGSPDRYTRTDDQFGLRRVAFGEWKSTRAGD
jgi:flavin reductase (DIM6/NTAB) family NADH-FMN oxidoreductase RutF